MTTDPESRFTRRVMGLLALGAAVFTVYGSLVPLDFRSREWPDAVNTFRWAMTHRWWYESRSDAIVNVMLGVPLGFGLLGCLRAGRTNRLGDVAIGAAILPLCLLFAAAVEFSQLYTPTRTTAGSDVLCQGLGSAIGMLLWVIAGRWLLRQMEDAWTGTEPAGRILVGYLTLLAFVQLLPLDITASPAEVYRVLRKRVEYVPFAEFGREDPWIRIARLLEVFALYLPIGMLASRVYSLRGCVNAPFAVAIPVAMELLQVPVISRFSTASDALLGTVGIAVGVWCSRAGGRMLFVGLWMIGVVYISWQPFELDPNRSLAFDWLPGLPAGMDHPLFALEDLLTKLILFGVGGAILGSRSALVFGLAVSGMLEAGQSLFVSRLPCVTDVLLGGAGAWIGSRIRRRVDHF